MIRTVVKALAVTAAVLLPGQLAAGTAHAADPVFQIWNVGTGDCLDSDFAGDVYSVACLPASSSLVDHQRWIRIPADYPGGGYLLQNKKTKRCLQWSTTSTNGVWTNGTCDRTNRWQFWGQRSDMRLIGFGDPDVQLYDEAGTIDIRVYPMPAWVNPAVNAKWVWVSK
ncbi:hypothetical protein AB0J52_18605 [Spirillospora sp. NPDC049652]